MAEKGGTVSTATKGERRLLSENEYEPLVQSHHPALQQLDHRELVELARWLRSHRARAQDIIRDRRRVRRGKAEPRSVTEATSSERGLAAKKQVFARALKRVNARHCISSPPPGDRDPRRTCRVLPAVRDARAAHDGRAG